MYIKGLTIPNSKFSFSKFKSYLFEFYSVCEGLAVRLALFLFFLNSILVSQVQKLKELKELSLPTVAEELRQQSFWRSFLSSKTYVLTP